MSPNQRTYGRHDPDPDDHAFICPDCSALVVDTRQHDRWHLVLAHLGHVPVVRTGGTVHSGNLRPSGTLDG